MNRFALAAMLLVVASSAVAQESKVATLHAGKIYCGACAAVITKALRGVPGVTKIDVDVDKKEITVQFDPARARVEDLTAATAEKGFPSSVRKVAP